MAHITINETIQSCPRCGKKLLKVTTGSVLIGSPLITCKKCGTTCRTNLRAEWYKHPAKKTVFVVPAILPFGLLLLGLFVGDPETAIFTALFGVIFSVCFLTKDVIRILLSKKRMRSKAYLQRLLMAQMISMDEYAQFSMNAK